MSEPEFASYVGTPGPSYAVWVDANVVFGATAVVAYTYGNCRHLVISGIGDDAGLEGAFDSGRSISVQVRQCCSGKRAEFRGHVPHFERYVVDSKYGDGDGVGWTATICGRAVPFE